MHAWIGRVAPEGDKPPVRRPFNYVRFVAGTTIILGIISVISVAHPYLVPVLQNRNLWATISLITILLFTSGQMFNHIRKVPYVSGDGKGGISYFAGGFQNQFGMETQIVAAMCEYPGAPYPRRLLKFRRWNSIVRNHRTSAQSASDGRSEEATGGCIHMGWRHVGNVQLSLERLPDEERGLSLPFASVLR